MENKENGKYLKICVSIETIVFKGLHNFSIHCKISSYLSVVKVKNEAWLKFWTIISMKNDGEKIL